MTRSTTLLAVVLAATGVRWLHGQAPDQKPLSFEVASVKENTSIAEGGGGRIIPGGGIALKHVPTRQNVTMAFQLEQYRLVGAPAWMATTYYDVQATPATTATRSANVPGPENHRFEVASVKPAPVELLTQRGLACGFVPGGRFMAFGTAKWIIACAYGVPPARKEQQILGGPEWLDRDLYEIKANAPEGAIPKSQVEGLGLLRTLLSERFQLKIHNETRQMPAYALVVARRDGRLGPKLRATSATCAAWISSGRRGAPPETPADQPPCFRQKEGPSTIRWTGLPLSHLADVLASRFQRPVRDQTGLAGRFDVDMEWQSDAPLVENPSAPSDTLNLLGALSTALREQLGLKLQSEKSSVDVLVIDHVDRPTDN